MKELEAELEEAMGDLRRHLASWPRAFALAGRGDGEHPALRAVRAENDRLRARCRELRARLSALPR